MHFVTTVCPGKDDIGKWFDLEYENSDITIVFSLSNVDVLALEPLADW